MYKLKRLVLNFKILKSFKSPNDTSQNRSEWVQENGILKVDDYIVNLENTSKK